MERAVGRQQGRGAQIHHPVQRVFAGCGWHVRVQPPDGFAQAKRQQHLAVADPLGVRAVVGDVRAGKDRVAQLGEPAQRFLFELVFGHGRALDGGYRCISSM